VYCGLRLDLQKAVLEEDGSLIRAEEFVNMENGGGRAG